jgi:hypothetical protein
MESNFEITKPGPCLAGALLIVLALLSCTSLGSGDTTAVSYPSGYRDWTHVKSSLITEENPFFDRFGGIHHVYANGPALWAMKKQILYPDDAVLVFDLLSAVRVDGGLISGERRRIDVMQRGQQRFPKTGGWGYASFKGSGEERVAQDVTEACHGCHVNGLGELQAVNGVFSEFPD